MERTTWLFNKGQEGDLIVYGSIATSLAVIGIVGEWGGNNVRLEIHVFDNTLPTPGYVPMARFKRKEWEDRSSGLPHALALGEGSNIAVKLVDAKNDTELVVTIRDVRLGRRGG